MHAKQGSTLTPLDDPTPWRAAGAHAIDRAQGCLLGQLAGDSLGALVEFKTKAEIARLYPDGVKELADGGPWQIIAGQATDDSEMALSLARTLVEDRRFDPERVFSAYIGWKNSAPFDIGMTTAAALSVAFERRGSQSAESQANGSLMRTSPIGIFAAGDPRRAAALAKADSLLTHPHPICMAACAAYAAAISAGVGGGDRDHMTRAALAQAGVDAAGNVISEALRAAQSTPPSEFQHQMGWVLIALQNAFYHLAAGHSIQNAVSMTVAEGGDTDTNGAIVGALIGAADGISLAPIQWVKAVTTCRPGPLSGAVHPRPQRYWPADCLELATQLLFAGVV